MLDYYMDKQKEAYEILHNELINDKISHAYLFVINNYSLADNMILSFVKDIIGQNHTVSEREIISKRIDDGNYSELKIIEPDGLYIKKQQIIDLQQEFSRSSLEGDRKIYIIKDADKMRTEAANSMLKFLEEPEGNIVAILVTNNYNNMLQTIISRCQLIKFQDDTVENMDNDNLGTIIEFLFNIEKYGNKTFLKTKELWYDKIDSKNRELLILLVDIMIDFYYDIYKYKNEKVISNKYSEYLEKIDFIRDNNSGERILEKINYLLEVKDVIKFNVNINLFIDNLIINIGGSNESSWC